MGAVDSGSLRSKNYAHMKEFVWRPTFVPFRRFLRDMRCEFMQRHFVVLNGTMMGFCLRDALQEGGATAVACFLAPRA
jgi:hypothetical protein